MTTLDTITGDTAPLALSVEEFCELYGVGMTHAYSERNAGRLTMRKTGKRTLILRSDAERWANSLPVAYGRKQRTAA